MKYSNELISEVKRLYPNSPEIHKLADSGNHFLGRWLEDSSHGGISPETILSIHHIDAIHAKARELKAKQDLYKKWWKEVEAAKNL